MGQLIHPELSYEVRNVLLHVYNTLGPMLKEGYYESGITIGLNKRQIRCQTQRAFEVYYEGERVGLYIVDVWIEDGKILPYLSSCPLPPGARFLTPGLSPGYHDRTSAQRS
jgi:hypothetical protein